jgi:hypothetical protein
MAENGRAFKSTGSSSRRCKTLATLEPAETEPSANVPIDLDGTVIEQAKGPEAKRSKPSSG